MEFLKLLEGLRTPFLDEVFSFFTLFGEELIILAVVCALFWCVDKELAYRVGVTFFASGLLVQGLKITFRIDRPWVLDPSFEPVAGSKTTATGYSFPSGHTQGASGLYGPIALEKRRWWLRALCCLLIVAVGLSRMYLGVHTPADVLVGFGLTAVIAVGVHFLLNACVTKRANLVLSICMLLFGAAVAIYALTLFSRGIIAREYAADCCKAAGAGIGFAAGFFIERTMINFEVRTSRWYMQLVKFAAGIAGTLAFKEGLKYVLGHSLVADAVRYLVTVLWVIAVFPLIVKAVSKRAQAKAADADGGERE